VHHRRQRGSLHAACLFLTWLLAAAGIQAQTNYTAQNFNTNAGYKRGVGIISTNQPIGLRWQGNDPYNSGTGLGETDYVARVPGYTPSPLANSSLIQGGISVGSGVLPGTNRVRIWKSFTPPVSGSSVFFAEWSLIPSLEGAPYNLADTFAFDLRNAANTQSLLKLQLTPGINIQPGSYTLQSIATGYGTNTIVDLSYQALFQVTVAMTSSNWNLSLAAISLLERPPSISPRSGSTGTWPAPTISNRDRTTSLPTSSLLSLSRKLGLCWQWQLCSPPCLFFVAAVFDRPVASRVE